MYTTLTVKGQATIPAPIRKKLNLKPGEKILFEEQDGQVVVKAVPNFLDLMGSLKTDKKYDKEKINQAIGEMFVEKQKRINGQTSRC